MIDKWSIECILKIYAGYEVVALSGFGNEVDMKLRRPKREERATHAEG